MRQPPPTTLSEGAIVPEDLRFVIPCSEKRDICTRIKETRVRDDGDMNSWAQATLLAWRVIENKADEFQAHVGVVVNRRTFGGRTECYDLSALGRQALKLHVEKATRLRHTCGEIVVSLRQMHTHGALASQDVSDCRRDVLHTRLGERVAHRSTVHR